MAVLISSGRIAANNSASVVNSFDEWHAGGGSFNLRPLSRASVNRKLRTRYYMQKMLEISEIFRLIETGEVGFQLSADASSMLGYEMLASALYANGCIFTGRRGLDGLLRPNIFLHKYMENGETSIVRFFKYKPEGHYLSFNCLKLLFYFKSIEKIKYWKIISISNSLK